MNISNVYKTLIYIIYYIKINYESCPEWSFYFYFFLQCTYRLHIGNFLPNLYEKTKKTLEEEKKSLKKHFKLEEQHH